MFKKQHHPVSSNISATAIVLGKEGVGRTY